MPRSLADGRAKFVILPQRPADPLHPTVAELEDGIDASCRVLSSDYNVGPTASETVDEKPLCVEGNAQAPGPSNYQVEFTVFRYFDDETGQAEESTTDDIGDAVYQAVKVKGTELYVYERFTSKKSTVPFADGDEVSGYHVVTDNPQKTDLGGYIKWRITTFPQDAWLHGVVGGTGS